MSDGPTGVRGEGHGSAGTPGVAVPAGIVSFNGVATLSGTIEEALLDDGGTLECSSCHDVHNKWANSHLLNVPYESSQICETCHAKG